MTVMFITRVIALVFSVRLLVINMTHFFLFATDSRTTSRLAYFQFFAVTYIWSLKLKHVWMSLGTHLVTAAICFVKMIIIMIINMSINNHTRCWLKVCVCTNRRRGKMLIGCFAVCWLLWNMLFKTQGHCFHLFPSSTSRDASVHIVLWSRISLQAFCRFSRLVCHSGVSCFLSVWIIVCTGNCFFSVSFGLFNNTIIIRCGTVSYVGLENKYTFFLIVYSRGWLISDFSVVPLLFSCELFSAFFCLR